MRLYTLTSVLLVISLLTLRASAADEYWPGWLGPNRDGWVATFEPPAQWPETLKRDWQLKVGTGYATPLVADGRVYQYARQGEEEVLWCLALDSGDVVWRTSYPVPFTMGQGGEWHGKGPKGAPILADDKLFTMNIAGTLSAWSAKTGERLWYRDYDSRFKKKSTPYWGATTSPIVAGNTVIVHFGNDDQGLLVALDVETGEEVWTQPEDAPSYSSPLLVEIDGVPQIVEWNHRAVVGIDVKSGEVLWEYPFEHQGTNQNMPTPAFHNGLVLVGGENRGVRGVEPVRSGSDWSAKERWHQKRVALDMSSAVVNDDLLYGFSHLGKGRLFCLEPKSGEILWQGPGRSADNATFLAVPGYVLMLLDKGELHVIKATPERYEKVAEYEVADSPTWAAPVLLERGLLVKDQTHLTRWSFGD